MIKQITKAYVRHYRDNGQTTAYVEWLDYRGEKGCTEGAVNRACLGRDGLPQTKGAVMAEVYGSHMGALLARAVCSGVEIKREIW